MVNNTMDNTITPNFDKYFGKTLWLICIDLPEGVIHKIIDNSYSYNRDYIAS
jgi:hypothetical protein